ncbi:MAG: dTMP kinase [Deltaproteobacteria bacterium RIFCSPLOWO2_02_FULL_44_10]|nr:MAG: dTMP kinase [Deltaproteobacteria bacterium RIFCSPHIGHO2_02_FULL_44_16]OGQ46147.1 MAG: dTMP kinase [Deltaproteobacteria bacterium RIFCSPLOWO2_02_FULL_44_10]
MKGTFITFEGIEGSGKSTHLELAGQALAARKYDVLLTREPGGTPVGDSLRRILLDPQNHNMDPTTELFLYAAARRQHIAQVIGPALKREKIILCDRYVDATTAYQGSARDLPEKLLRELNHIATEGLMPSLTLLFDCTVEVGLTRARKRNQQETLKGQDRFEREAFSFHEKVRSRYLSLAKADPQRIKIIDTTHQNVHDIHAIVMKEILAHVGTHSRT